MDVVALSLVALEAGLCRIVPQIQPVVDRDPRLLDLWEEAHHGVARRAVVLLKYGVGDGVIVDARKWIPGRLLGLLVVHRLTLCRRAARQHGRNWEREGILRDTMSSSMG